MKGASLSLRATPSVHDTRALPSSGRQPATAMPQSVMCSAPAKLLGEYQAHVRFALSKFASRSLALVRAWPHGRHV
jgi:hypothetical protein